MPEWAKEIVAIIDKVKKYFNILILIQSKELKNYLTMQSEIGLDANFLSRSKEQLIRFDNEIKFRKQEEAALKLLEEEKKKKAAKKK